MPAEKRAKIVAYEEKMGVGGLGEICIGVSRVRLSLCLPCLGRGGRGGTMGAGADGFGSWVVE